MQMIVPDSTSPVRLIMTTATNSNKFYTMIPHGSTFTVEYGRVDVTKSTETYPIGKWATKYKEKVKKGYKDVTHLVKENVNTTKSEYVKIADTKVDSLFNLLLSYSNQSVKENYSISSDSVTQAQVSEAQDRVNELVGLTSNQEISNVDRFNKLLLDLYTVIPRRMKKVQDHLIPMDVGSTHKYQLACSIIDNEQKTLDVMRGQVQMREIKSPTVDTPNVTILDALGIEVEVGSLSDIELVKKMMGQDSNELKAVYKVTHKESRTKYEQNLDRASNRKQELFWHGSRNENWIGILGQGLRIRPSTAILTGSMWGHGIYGADKYRKSANYTSLRGSYWARGSANTAFLALMDFHVGNQYVLSRHTHDCYNLSRDVLKNKGNYDSLFARGGADLINNEYVVYDENQCTIRYLIQIEK